MAGKKTTENKEKKAPAKPARTGGKPVVKTVSKKEAKPAVKKEKPAKNGAFAVIATGGKQYVVREGDTISVEKLADGGKEGAKIEFKEVLLVEDGTATKVGEPTVSGAKVSAELVAEGRGKKISVIRFKSKSRYFKNKGHRQPFTKVKITNIS
jgi:large subunit ribosomal protein L21